MNNFFNLKQLPQVKAYEKYQLWQLQRRYPYVQWVEYLNALLPHPLSVNLSEEVIVWVPTYFDALGRLLNATPKRITANFLMWKMIEYSTSFLTNELAKRRFAFERMIYGKQKQEARWMTCTDTTNERYTVWRLKVFFGDDRFIFIVFPFIWQIPCRTWCYVRSKILP